MPEDCTQTNRAEHAALELFQTAALLLGDTAEAVAAVEATVAQVKVDPCADPEAARREAERELVELCITRLRLLHEEALQAPSATDRTPQVTCIETQGLDPGAAEAENMARLLEGAGRERMRLWLNDLHPALRIAFVLRAVLGMGGDEAAGYLRAAGAGPWTPALVGDAFREALCSLTSSLLHAASPLAATA